MKKKWSSKWKGSKQPRKQRKYRYNAPLHVKHKFVTAHLSKELREKYNKRSIPVRKGDEVKIMVGDSKGLTGIVNRVSLKKCKIYVDGITVKKVDGSEVLKPLEPSNLMITKLNLDDKKRQKVFERSKQIRNEAKKIKGGMEKVQKIEKL